MWKNAQQRAGFTSKSAAAGLLPVETVVPALLARRYSQSAGTADPGRTRRRIQTAAGVDLYAVTSSRRRGRCRGEVRSSPRRLRAAPRWGEPDISDRRESPHGSEGDGGQRDREMVVPAVCTACADRDGDPGPRGWKVVTSRTSRLPDPGHGRRRRARRSRGRCRGSGGDHLRHHDRDRAAALRLSTPPGAWESTTPPLLDTCWNCTLIPKP